MREGSQCERYGHATPQVRCLKRSLTTGRQIMIDENRKGKERGPVIKKKEGHK